MRSGCGSKRRETRGAFYEGMGALRDVGQNHLLKMAALVTMEQPVAFTAEAALQPRGNPLENRERV